MLRHLLKYEYKATKRTFFPIYIALLLVAMVNRIFHLEDADLGLVIVILALTGLFIGLVIITIMAIVQRFNKNLLGDEGYLMFTLPVTSDKLIYSKLLISIMWSIISVIVAILTFFILFGTLDDIIYLIQHLDEIGASLVREIKFEGVGITSNDVTPLQIISLLSMLFIFNYALFILQVYLALAIAQLPKLSKFRSIVGFVAYFIINTITLVITEVVSDLAGIITFKSTIGCMMALGLFYFALCVIHFIATKWVLDKHLNLE